ncbi:hypothetical protein [Rhodanobacter hydrolyticus]|uniref:hypothetical protein n=1 Tax=Rhodanobacter hydrolyticus TaxID=2250595 RepID=UPI00384ADE84
MRHLKELFQHGRGIACVRHVSWIIDSIERLIRKDAFKPSSIFNYVPGGTVYSRVEGLANGEGMVGCAYNGLKEAFYGDEASKLMLLRYETPTSDPARAIASIYDFIGEPACKHGFDDISYHADEFDLRAGIACRAQRNRCTRAHQRVAAGCVSSFRKRCLLARSRAESAPGAGGLKRARTCN